MSYQENPFLFSLTTRSFSWSEQFSPLLTFLGVKHMVTNVNTMKTFDKQEEPEEREDELKKHGMKSKNQLTFV